MGRCEPILRARRQARHEEWYDDRLRELAPSTADDPATKRWWRSWVQTSASPGAIKAISLMNSDISVCHVLPAIQVPTLVLNRTGDEDVPIESMRWAADRIPGASFGELDGGYRMERQTQCVILGIRARSLTPSPRIRR